MVSTTLTPVSLLADNLILPAAKFVAIIEEFTTGTFAADCTLSIYVGGVL